MRMVPRFFLFTSAHQKAYISINFYMFVCFLFVCLLMLLFLLSTICLIYKMLFILSENVSGWTLRFLFTVREGQKKEKRNESNNWRFLVLVLFFWPLEMQQTKIVLNVCECISSASFFNRDEIEKRPRKHHLKHEDWLREFYKSKWKMLFCTNRK